MDKDAEIKKVYLEKEKMNEVLNKNGEELEHLRNQFAEIKEVSKIEIEALQAQVAAQKNGLELIEVEVTTTVKAKFMYQYRMKRTSSWNPLKQIDLYLKWVVSMKDLVDPGNLNLSTAKYSTNVVQ